MGKKTVYLVQDTKESIDKLKENFSKTEEVEVVGSNTDGAFAVVEIKRLDPDFVITDLVLSGSDGIEVIEKLKESVVSPKIVVLTAFSSEEIISRVMSLGANYFMAKPYNFSLLKERMEDLTLSKPKAKEEEKRFGGISLEEKISNIFINVGIPPHIKGYSFLREGVKMAVETPDIINNITKKLYPKIGKKFSTTASKVERAIRHAIEVAWNRGRIESINTILGVRAYVGAEKPTNGEFIALVADKMLLERA